MTQLTDRIIRAAKLDAGLYEEVERDDGALAQAMGVVVLSSLAAGIGTTLRGGIGGLVWGAAAALISWYIWAWLTYLVGTKVLPGRETRADVGQLLRTIGFSSSPGLIRVFGIIPGLTSLVFLVASVWMLVAMVLAVKQALDYGSALRALAVVLIGWVVQGVILYFLFALLAGPGGIAL